MGIFYLDHFDEDEFFACAHCETHIAVPEDIVSKVGGGWPFTVVKASFNAKSN